MQRARAAGPVAATLWGVGLRAVVPVAATLGRKALRVGLVAVALAGLALVGASRAQAAPAAGSAQRAQDTFFNSVIPSRIDHLIGFATTTLAIHPPDQRVVPISVKSGGRRYRFIFGNAAAVVGPSADIYLRNMIRVRRFPSPQGVFLDRRLTASERRHLQVRLDLARDADVLAVAAGHPACTSGVSRAVARKIAAGTIRSWSEAGVPTPTSGDAIALRRAGTGVERFVEPRFGAGNRLPRGARAAHDGGLSEAASGDLSIAAVTSWSRARAFGGATCAVPVGGSAPSDASVLALSHPDAYPISFVTLRRLRDVGPIVAAFVKYLTGPRATTTFRQRGMLLVDDLRAATARSASSTVAGKTSIPPVMIMSSTRPSM